MSDGRVHVFGVRHHGPGSARSLLAALEALRPDCVLIEGPPDADALIAHAAHADMAPPVAILVYMPERPSRAAFYPFAEFSPEWQAMRFALRTGAPARFMDLPQAFRMADEAPPERHTDALGLLAAAAGDDDGERWWDRVVEHRRDGADAFLAVREMMATLRGEAPPVASDVQREAHMRQTIRAALKEGRERIAVVCGAWHAPALDVREFTVKDDAALLKGLPKVKVESTWVPWTHGRLTFASGYGAGVESPGWYHHLWTAPDALEARWLARVARLLRDEDVDVSSGHVIEAVRLAEALATLRGRRVPGLADLNEAIESVFCFGAEGPLALVHEKLVVGEVLGAVPEDVPVVPLQRDLQRLQKSLRLPPTADDKQVDLDLRKPNDLDRSRLLHRLHLLGVEWGTRVADGRGKGTFHENWRLRWQPELAIALIEAGIWGNTVEDAAAAFAVDQARRAPDLPALSALLDRVLLADLGAAVPALMRRIETEAALVGDVPLLMRALPSLANVLRYGDVRGTDTALVGHVVDGLVVRVAVGLPGACAALDDDAAADMAALLETTHRAVGLTGDAEHPPLWHGALTRVAALGAGPTGPAPGGAHGRVAGRAVRLLHDARAMPPDEVARHMGLALSTAGEPARAAGWIEGFLTGGGLVLLHDADLWGLVDGWLASLRDDAFVELVPLLRRTFSTFPAPERRQIGERARRGAAAPPVVAAPTDFDTARADAAMPLVAQMLGLAT